VSRQKKFELIIRSGKVEGEASLKVNLSRLGLRTGYSVSHLSRVFRGETNPSVQCLAKVASAMDLNISKLYAIIQGAKNETRSVRVQSTSIGHKRAQRQAMVPVHTDDVQASGPDNPDKKLPI